VSEQPSSSSPSGRLVVVTPWYPGPEHPSWGASVRSTVGALRDQYPDPLVVHVVARTADDGRPAPEPLREVVDGVDVLRVPVIAGPTMPRARLAELTRDALAPFADELADADVVHVHALMPTGWAVVELIGSRTRVVVTEHGLDLGEVWDDTDSAALCASAVRGSAAVVAVSEVSARELRAHVPEAADRIHTVPPAVDVTRFEPRAGGAATLDRWLHIGLVAGRDEVERLVRAFARWRGRRPTATLEVVGAGEGSALVRDLADELGVADAVMLREPVAPDDVAALFGRVDVLVHLSSAEPMGIAPVEALAAGIPVVATATAEAQRTLDVAQDLWAAWLVPASGDVDDVIAAVDGLEARHRSARPDLVREDLATRFGTEHVARSLGHLLSGEPETDLGADSPVVVAIALHRSSQAAAVRTARDAARRGARAYLVTDDGADVDVDDRVTVLDVAAARYAVPTHRLERLVVDALPRAVLSAARPVARAVGRDAALDVLDERHRSASQWFKRKVGERAVHAHVDPLVLARHVERTWGHLLVGPVLITWGDPRGIPLAAALARANPDAVVVRTVHHDRLVELVDRAPSS